MIGMGTLINTGAIVAGGFIGLFAGRLFREESQASIGKACGVSTIFIAIAGAMSGMLKLEDGALTSWAPCSASCWASRTPLSASASG